MVWILSNQSYMKTFMKLKLKNEKISDVQRALRAGSGKIEFKDFRETLKGYVEKIKTASYYAKRLKHNPHHSDDVAGWDMLIMKFLQLSHSLTVMGTTFWMRMNRKR